MNTALLSLLAAATLGFSSVSEPPQNSRTTGRIPVLIVTGENNHDWRWTSTKMRQVLHDSGKFRVEVSIYPAGLMMDRSQLDQFEVILLDYNGKRWGEAAEKNFLDVVKEGTGVVSVHAADNAFTGWKEYEKLIGNLWREESGHTSFHEFDVKIANAEHPVTQGMPPMKAHPDELYHGLVDTQKRGYEVLATAYSDPAMGGTGNEEPVVFAGQYGEGRVLHTTLGHCWYGDQTTWASHNDEQFQELLIRATEWAATGKVTPLSRVEPNTLTAADRAAGWKLLFDGNSSNGWKGFRAEGFPADRWKVEGGCLKVVTEDSGHLIHEAIHDDFELELEWRVSENADAGIFYRVGEQGDEPGHTGPGYDLSRGEDANAGLIGGAERILRPVGEFNHARIVAQGRVVEHWLNGVKLMSLNMSTTEWAEAVSESHLRDYPNFSRLPIGRIALSGGGTDVWFRNIKIRELTPEAGVHEATQPVSLFDGRTLTGWSPWLVSGGRATIFQVDDGGNLVCNGLASAYLATNKSYEDYRLEFDWRYPPTTLQAGDGAILLRGVPWNDWIRGVAVRFQHRYAGDLWSHEGFPLEADRDRTNGGQIRKLKDTEKPVGEWNHVEVQLIGDRVTVTMNGEVVNEASGLDIVPGQIAILSGGFEMQYRNLKLTPVGE